MPSVNSSPAPSKSLNHVGQQTSSRYRDAVSQGVRLRIHQLIQAGVLHPARPNKQCGGHWKPRMDLVDDPSSPNIIAIFELPGVKNENISLQIKDKRLLVIGQRVDPFAEALASVAALGAPDSRTEALSPPTTKTLTNARTNASSIAARNSTGGAGPLSTNKSIRELRYGSFFRSIPVPEGIKQSQVSAGIQDGMLTVTWPRVPTTVRQSGVEIARSPKASSTSVHTTEATSAPHSSGAASMLQ